MISLGYKKLYARHQLLLVDYLLDLLTFLSADHALAIVRGFLNEVFGHLLNKLSPVSALYRCLIISKQLNAGFVTVIQGKLKRSLSRLVLFTR